MSSSAHAHHPEKLPSSSRGGDAMQGHWLLARLGTGQVGPARPRRVRDRAHHRRG
jgi:hypothetical protein